MRGDTSKLGFNIFVVIRELTDGGSGGCASALGFDIFGNEREATDGGSSAFGVDIVADRLGETCGGEAASALGLEILANGRGATGGGANTFGVTIFAACKPGLSSGAAGDARAAAKLPSEVVGKRAHFVRRSFAAAGVVLELLEQCDVVASFS